MKSIILAMAWVFILVEEENLTLYNTRGEGGSIGVIKNISRSMYLLPNELKNK